MQREIVDGVSFRSRFDRQEVPKPILATVCACMAMILVSSLCAWATPLPPQDVDSSSVTYDSGGKTINAFLAMPKGGEKHPAVIVVHDNQGLSDAMRDIAQKFAAEGFVALAPDLLSRTGGTKSPEQAVGAVRQLVPLDTVSDLRNAFAYLQNNPSVDPQKISVVGFGWGGWRSFELAAAVPDLYRSVVYSGATPMDGLQNIRTPILANYGQYDFFNAGNSIWTTNTMKGLGKQYRAYIYPKAQAGFYNSKSRQYDAEAAKTAWTRTLEFLKS